MNFGELVALIADDLVDERLTNVQIQNAVNQAMRFYSRKTFYFNTIKDTINVIPGQEYYVTTNASIFMADLYTIQTVKFRPNGDPNGWPLVNKADATIENAVQGGTVKPSHWAYAQMQLRLYPIPDIAGSITILATYMYPKLAEDDDTNVFLERADELIRQAAKRYLAFNVLHDQGLGDRAASMEAEEFASLQAENRNRDPVELMEAPNDLVSLAGPSGMYDIRIDR